MHRRSAAWAAKRLNPVDLRKAPANPPNPLGVTSECFCPLCLVYRFLSSSPSSGLKCYRFFPFLFSLFLPFPKLLPRGSSKTQEVGRGGVKLHICCCLSGAPSPAVGCVSVAVGVATRRVEQTDTEARYVLCFATLLWGVQLHICCCISGVPSPSVRYASVAVGVATRRVQQTDIDARYLACFAILVCFC